MNDGADRLWSVSEHLENILAQLNPLEPIELQLLDAQGCVLVEDVTVPTALPPFENSSIVSLPSSASARKLRYWTPRSSFTLA